jgi:hypothetical protein
MRALSAILKSLVLLAVAGFCGFGYLATFEPTDRPGVFMAFRIGYAVIGIGSLAGIVAVITRHVRRAIRSDG